MRKIKALALLVILLVSAGGTLAAKDKPSVQGPSLAVGSQYDGAPSSEYGRRLARERKRFGERQENLSSRRAFSYRSR